MGGGTCTKPRTSRHSGIILSRKVTGQVERVHERIDKKVSAMERQTTGMIMVGWT